MYQPNNDSIDFCNWMLDISRQKLSGPQRLIVETVRDAAIGNYPITDNTWWNFNLFTAWRNKYYLVYKMYASFSSPNLLTGLVYGCNLDGNSNDVLGSRNGTDTDVSYSTSYGKINEGANYNLSTSKTDFTSLTLISNWTIAFWVNPQSIPAPYGTALGILSGGQGIVIITPGLEIDYFNGGDFTTTTGLTNNAWNLCILRCHAGVLSWTINNVIQSTTGSASSTVQPYRIGSSAAGYYLGGFMDMLYMWNRSLLDQECDDLWNGGAGIQYPF